MKALVAHFISKVAAAHLSLLKFLFPPFFCESDHLKRDLKTFLPDLHIHQGALLIYHTLTLTFSRQHKAQQNVWKQSGCRFKHDIKPDERRRKKKWAGNPKWVNKMQWRYTHLYIERPQWESLCEIEADPPLKITYRLTMLKIKEFSPFFRLCGVLMTRKVTHVWQWISTQPDATVQSPACYWAWCEWGNAVQLQTAAWSRTLTQRQSILKG